MARPAFKDVVDEPQYIDVDSLACIQFANIRKKTDAFMLRFVCFFSGLSFSALGLSSESISYGPDIEIVLALAGHDVFHLKVRYRWKRFLPLPLRMSLITRVCIMELFMGTTIIRPLWWLLTETLYGPVYHGLPEL